MTTTTRPRFSAEERRIQIIRAATTVFARSNYRLAGTADIAREVGISEPAIYKHFPSKKALFLRILKDCRESMLGVWQQVVDSEEQDSVSALRRMVRVFVEVLRAHPDEVKIQFQALAESDDPDIARQLRENNEAYVRFLAQLIDRAKSESVVPAEVDPYVTGWLINSIGITLSLVRLLDFDKNIGERRVVEAIDGYLDWLTGHGPAGADDALSDQS